MQRLKDKVAIVTGASKGMGAAIAQAMALEGAAVVVNYASSQAPAEQVVRNILQQGGRAIAVAGDVSKLADTQRLVQAALKAFGQLDILVNNSGIYEFAPIEHVTEAHFRKHFDINVLGLLFMTQSALAHMRPGASIVNISSIATRITPPESAVYSGTKGAVDAITGVLSRELGPRHIRVNAVNPGMVETEGLHSAGIAGSSFHAETIRQTPLGRIGQPQDIATIVCFLASDDARWLSGEHLLATGGLR